MQQSADAWVLYAGDADAVSGELAELVREPFGLPDLGPNDVLAEPIYGCWEGNMHHAVTRSPIDICKARREARVVVGNGGVVRVLRCGPAVERLSEGQVAMMFPSSTRDRWGHMTEALAYDAPGTMGCLSKRMVLGAEQLLPIPEDTSHSLRQWAAFCIRHVTAWANWRLAWGVFRLQVGADELPSPNIWGWGGGTTLAELRLAKHDGCRCVMLSGDDERLEAIARAGIEPLDRRKYSDLSIDVARYDRDSTYRKQVRDSERRFVEDVKRLTDGFKVQVFVDYIGAPTLRATLKAMGQQSVLTTAGWKEGMSIQLHRASECIGRRQHIHTHYARRSEAQEAMAFGEKEGWMPEPDERLWGFDEIPALARAFAGGQVGFFPTFQVNPE